MRRPLLGSLRLFVAGCSGNDLSSIPDASVTADASVGTDAASGADSSAAADATDAGADAGDAACPGWEVTPVTPACTVGAACTYPEGICRCGSCPGGGPPPKLNGDADGGSFGAWRCTPHQAGCPDDVPEAGAACSPEGQGCWYVPCCDVNVQCVDGGWVVGQPQCPV
jgi:hypothetical protein